MSVIVTDDRRRFDALRADLAKLKEGQVSIGIHEADNNDRDDEMSNAEIGLVHELGLGKVPRRSFLQDTLLSRKRQETEAEIVNAAERVIHDGVDPEDALDAAAMVLQDFVQDAIADGIDPPLGPAAIKAREARMKGGKGAKRPANTRWAGHKPLILTGQLRTSIRGVASFGAQRER